MTDGYAPGWVPDAVGMMTARSASDRAEFALSMLSNGDRVIDVGCGPGTITVGLASAIGSTGRAIGVDAQLSQIQAATAAAPKSAAFAVASAYALPLSDQSVDIVAYSSMPTDI
jgi:ubiquinone/menaquinone biosynthesis C-methylase UbiE